MTGKRVLVTGAHGFIGRHVARHFSSAGWTVTGIGHGNWSPEEWGLWGISDWHAADLTIESMLTYAGRPDVIVQCAGSGSVGFSHSNPAQDFERNVDTTLNVLEFARLHAPAAKIVMLSSGAVYGAVEPIPIPETSPLGPVSPYGVHKKIAEELCQSYAHHFGLAVVVLRLFSAYGAGLSKQLLWDACNKVRKSELTFFGTGGEIRDWIHVDDVASLIEASLEPAAPSTCLIANGGTGEGVSVREILCRLFDCLGKKARPAFSSQQRIGDPSHFLADDTKIRTWGWRPRMSWRAGIKEYADWYIRNMP